MDDDELLKGLTDCVYFLASPLTCKKGIECEYRHCEIARLNPRDCWYWLGGCCFNPDCAFRHPPLEGLKEAYYEPSSTNNGPALPMEKTNIPCYFYSKGFCNKGDRCSFLHGPTTNNTVPLEKKLSAGSNTGLTLVESQPDPPVHVQITDTHAVRKHTQDSHQLVSGSPKRSESPGTSANQSEENKVRSPEESVQSESDDVSNDQSSDQLADGLVERERWFDLSPGFDVLVEGESERLEYEGNDASYFSVHDERIELDVHYSEYDPVYPELGNQFRKERYGYDDYVPLDKMFGQSRESIFNRLSFKKGNLEMGPGFKSRRGDDLRDHLKQHKVIDDKGYDFDRRIRRNPRKFDFDHRDWLRKTVSVKRYKQPITKPRFLSSQVLRSRKPVQLYKKKPWEVSDSAVFTGPKTLEQIREEKKKSLANVDLGSFKRTESDGFQGPRPLSEILKNKRKLG